MPVLLAGLSSGAPHADPRTDRRCPDPVGPSAATVAERVLAVCCAPRYRAGSGMLLMHRPGAVRDEDELGFLMRRSAEEAVIAIGSASPRAAIVHNALSILYAARVQLLLREMAER